MKKLSLLVLLILFVLTACADKEPAEEEKTGMYQGYPQDEIAAYTPEIRFSWSKFA